MQTRCACIPNHPSPPIPMRKKIESSASAKVSVEALPKAPKEKAQKDRAQKDKAPTLAEEVQETLADLIGSGALKPGVPLDEAAPAARFQISRTPLREAFKGLAGSGLVEMRGQRGAFVAVISLPVLIEMFQMMSVMEGLCAKHAARRATAAQRAQLREIHDRLTEVLSRADHEQFYEVNREFHDA